ncbi:hypothetical protein EC957_001883 [Mortierella hygrophila]|uniref:Peptidase A1 domain-containing protein n=1 Tax=Mortierella hygrophila TaxID=979708 RepID=A0A9P6K2B8_9FUNG|nr:hypothetical protein EC957_001883 [Mortierella hygrophila]
MKTTTLLSLAVVASAFSVSASAAPDLHRVALDRVARTEEIERTSHQVQQALARYSQPSIAEIVQQQQQEQREQQGREEMMTEEEKEKVLGLEQRLLRIPSRVLRRLRGQAQVALVQEQRLEQEQEQEQDGQQQQEQRKEVQSAFSAEVGGTKEKNAKDKKTDKEYDVYEDDDDDDNDDDDNDGGDHGELEDEDEDEMKGKNAGGADKKEKEKEDKAVASVIELAQFDSASSRRSKTIDSERVPIEYNPSEVAFVGQVGIGTPNQYFNLEFDIGSSDTWVASARANCSQNSPCSITARRGFRAERSSTFESAPNISWHLELSNGPAVKGTLGTDVVQVAGFVVDRQVIGVADSLKNMKENGIDGSFGLGLTDLTFNGDPTPVDNLINANDMRSEVGVWFGSGNQGGELTFGGQDPARYTGSLSYYHVPAGSAYWSTPIHSLTVITDKSIELKDKIPRNKRTVDQVNSRVGTGTGISVPNVIFDTSTNIILVPPRVAYRTHQLIHDYFWGWYSGYSYISGLYTVSCDMSLIDLWFDLGPQAADPSPAPETIVASQDGAASGTTPTSPTSENLPQGSAQSSTSFTKGNITTTGEWTSTNKFRVRGQDLVRERVPVIGGIFNLCFSGIQASKNDEDDWVFGNIWFMSNYMTLDHRRRLIGIAPAVQS